MKMQIKQFEFYVEDDARYQFAVSWSEFIPAITHVMVVRTNYPSVDHATGAAIGAREDLPFDIRVGVPLALKRALGQLKGINRQEVTRAFFRSWPEAHPDFHDTPEQIAKRKFAVAAQIRAEAVLAHVMEENIRTGRFVVGRLPDGRVAISTGPTSAVLTTPEGGKRVCERGSCVRNPDHEGPCTTSPEVAKKWDAPCLICGGAPHSHACR